MLNRTEVFYQGHVNKHQLQVLELVAKFEELDQ